MERNQFFSGGVGFAMNGKPNFKGGLSGNFMKAQGREQTNDAVRDTLGGLN
jgi:hypothetical protein